MNRWMPIACAVWMSATLPSQSTWQEGRRGGEERRVEQGGGVKESREGHEG